MWYYCLFARSSNLCDMCDAWPVPLNPCDTENVLPHHTICLFCPRTRTTIIKRNLIEVHGTHMVISHVFSLTADSHNGEHSNSTNHPVSIFIAILEKSFWSSTSASYWDISRRQLIASSCLYLDKWLLLYNKKHNRAIMPLNLLVSSHNIYYLFLHPSTRQVAVIYSDFKHTFFFIFNLNGARHIVWLTIVDWSAGSLIRREVGRFGSRSEVFVMKKSISQHRASQQTIFSSHNTGQQKEWPV